MPIIYARHDCDPTNSPDIQGLSEETLEGAVWECPVCGTIWEVETQKNFAGVTQSIKWERYGDPGIKAVLRYADSKLEGTAPAPAAPVTITPRMIQLVLDTYEEHMSVAPVDGDRPDGTLGHCGECDTPIGPHTVQTHALEAAATALQSELTGHDTEQTAIRASLEEALAAWTTYGPAPNVHQEARQQVHCIMPLLAKALDKAHETRRLIRLRDTSASDLKKRSTEVLEGRHDH